MKNFIKFWLLVGDRSVGRRESDRAWFLSHAGDHFFPFDGNILSPDVFLLWAGTPEAIEEQKC
ncbi:MAG: hypothetical protein MUO42_12945 [Anaerolineaceae bacterium]|nr:hypothetical protein [Anaerolineaceae bacterium]